MTLQELEEKFLAHRHTGTDSQTVVSSGTPGARYAKMTLGTDFDLDGTPSYVIPFDTEAFSSGVTCNVATGKFEILRAGKYRINAQAYGHGVTAAQQYDLRLFRNSDDYLCQRQDRTAAVTAGGSTYQTFEIGCIVSLSVGDLVYFAVVSGGDVSTVKAGETKTWMTIELVD